MKGVIAQCLAEVIQDKFGKDTWLACLKRAGLPANTIVLPGQDLDDQTVMNLIKAICVEKGLSLQQAADAFGTHWVHVYAPRLYPHFFRGVDNAKDFLLKMDSVHVTTTKTVPNAHPPRFDYDWQDERTLIITYHSRRGLVDVLMGLVRAVGTKFGEPLRVEKAAPDRLKVVFS